MRTAVIAGTYSQFLDWCRERGLNPRSRDLIFVLSADWLQGQRDLEVVRTGTWADRRDLDEIEDMLRAVNRRQPA